MLWFLLGCTGIDTGASEPFRVRGGTFHPGALPVDETSGTPAVIYVSSVSYIVTQGQADIQYRGLASDDAWSIAVTFPDVSTGYWTVPVSGPDVTQDGNMLFGLNADFTRDVPYGLANLSFVAIDGNGHPGMAYDAKVCILPDFADNSYAACAPEVPPQHTILSLAWDTDVDLDLVVVTPAGKVVSPDSPSTAVDEDDTSEIGILSRDSNGGCAIDSIRLESLIFEEEPPAGDYQVYASLFSACGQASVQYSLSLFQRVESPDGTWSVDRSDLAAGALPGVEADGGASLGAFLGTVPLP